MSITDHVNCADHTTAGTVRDEYKGDMVLRCGQCGNILVRHIAAGDDR